MHVNRGRSLVLKDNLGPEIWLGFWIKKQVLHRELVHLKDSYGAFVT